MNFLEPLLCSRCGKSRPYVDNVFCSGQCAWDHWLEHRPKETSDDNKVSGMPLGLPQEAAGGLPREGESPILGQLRDAKDSPPADIACTAPHSYCGHSRSDCVLVPAQDEAAKPCPTCHGSIFYCDPCRDRKEAAKRDAQNVDAWTSCKCGTKFHLKDSPSGVCPDCRDVCPAHGENHPWTHSDETGLSCAKMEEDAQQAVKDEK